MTWETATVLGSLGVSFYLLYLSTLFNEDERWLKLALVLISFFSVSYTLSHIHSLIAFSAGGASDNIALAGRYYETFIFLGIGFASWLLLKTGGGWLRSFGKGA